MSTRHTKHFRAFNGQEAWDEPLTLHPPEGYVGRHHRDHVNTWYTGLVIWNRATELWDRVLIVGRYEPFMARYRTMSYPIDEDDETEWRQHG